MKKTPLKRTKIKKRHRTYKSKPQEKWTKKDYKDALDALWGKIIRRNGFCEICGSPDYLNAHHDIPRDHLFFRHNLENGHCLCSGCHTMGRKLPDGTIMNAHGLPWVYEAWMKKNQPERFKWWDKNRFNIPSATNYNYEQVYETLKAEAEKLGVEI